MPQAITCVLDDLWVEPARIGEGIGAQLFRFATDRARALGAERMEWGSDPNAVGFYEKLGAHTIGEHLSEWDRVTPLMAIDLGRTPG